MFWGLLDLTWFYFYFGLFPLDFLVSELLTWYVFVLSEVSFGLRRVGLNSGLVKRCHTSVCELLPEGLFGSHFRRSFILLNEYF